MLAMSTMPAFVAALSPVRASSGCSIAAVGEGYCLPFAADACEVTVSVSCCANSSTASVRCQGTNGPGLTSRLGRPIRVTLRDKIESLLRGQVILSI
jgi:hypothetical protein